MFYGRSSDDSAGASGVSGITANYPKFGDKGQCKCGKGCKTRFCNGYKFGGQYNPLFGTASSGQNMFNTLSYFFGDDPDDEEECLASECFAKWLVKNGRGPNGYQAIDRDALRNRIMASPSYSNVFFDENFKKWTKKWDRIKYGSDDAEKLAHTQKYFRMLLSSRPFLSKYYYSFCENDVQQDDCYYHCNNCQSCMSRRYGKCTVKAISGFKV